MAGVTSTTTERDRGLRERAASLELLKDDRPRRIDRYIDYFGDGAGRARSARRPRVITGTLLAS
jgi:hypothetical protein